MVSQERRKEIEESLRWGDVRRIAEIANVSPMTVVNYLKGRTKKSTAEPYILAFVEKRKKEIEEKISANFNEVANV